MDYTPVTPFRRTLDAAVLHHHAAARADLPPKGTNKWEVLRELAAARTVFGLSDRDITVLQALVSFHQATILGANDADLVVYPSNKAICERLNGMPCSTMRRHLAHLVQAGFVLRRDSPNGKRYARRYGDEKLAFGFDLSPLVRRFAEVCHKAEAVRADLEQFQRLRTKVSLMRRDLAGLVDYGRTLHPDLCLWDQLSDLAVLTARDLRRKLNRDELARLETVLSNGLSQASHAIEAISEKMSTSDGPNEQHNQNSDIDSYVYEPRLEKCCENRGADETPTRNSHVLETVLETDTEKDDHAVNVDEGTSDHPAPPVPQIPLPLVLATCHEVQTYAQHPLRHWHDLVTLASVIRPMLGISPSAWDDAQRQMGPEQAAVVLSAMLERFEDIRSPGGYLRALSAKAAAGQFSCVPMIMALTRKEAA